MAEETPRSAAVPGALRLKHDPLVLITKADALAKELYDAKRFCEAAHVAEATIGLSDRVYGALINAARCHIYAMNPARAEELLREAQTSPSRPLGDHDADSLLVLAFGWLGKHDEAEKMTRALPTSPENNYNLGWHLMRHGNFKDAFPLLEHGRNIGVWGDKDFRSPMPQWDGKEDISGKTILLNLERGLGDHIIQARHARELAERGAKVVVRTHSSLVMALSRAEGVLQTTAGLPEHDLWVPGMSAPLYLGVEKMNGKPYLKPAPWSLAAWKERLGSHTKPRIGIRWQGNPEFEHEQMRVLPAAELADSLRELGELYSFQRDAGAELCPAGVVDLSKELRSWEDTCAALSLMDVLVTSCTSVTHAAAAMGVPTVVITPILSYYPWSDETKMPESDWYDSVLVAKQTKIGSWKEAIMQAAKLAQIHLDKKTTV